MKVKQAIILMFAIGTAGMVQTAVAQEKLPSAVEVMKKYAAATGGVAKYKAVKSFKAKGKVSIAAMGMEGTVEMMQVLPNKLRVNSEIAGIGKMMQGSDGNVVWDMNPMIGARLVEGKEANALLEQGKMERIYDPESYYSKLENKGIEKVNGKDCYKIELVKQDGSKQTDFYDVATGLQTQSIATMEAMGNSMEMRSTIDEYKDFNGIKTPVKMTQYFPNFEQKMTFTEWTYNAEIPADAFALPAKIQKLVDKKKAKKDKKSSEGSDKK